MRILEEDKANEVRSEKIRTRLGSGPRNSSRTPKLSRFVGIT